jgi:hypothetical protein
MGIWMIVRRGEAVGITPLGVQSDLEHGGVEEKKTWVSKTEMAWIETCLGANAAGREQNRIKPQAGPAHSQRATTEMRISHTGGDDRELLAKRTCKLAWRVQHPRRRSGLKA